jgi:hypothetical protein
MDHADTEKPQTGKSSMMPRYPHLVVYSTSHNVRISNSPDQQQQEDPTIACDTQDMNVMDTNPNTSYTDTNIKDNMMQQLDRFILTQSYSHSNSPLRASSSFGLRAKGDNTSICTDTINNVTIDTQLNHCDIFSHATLTNSWTTNTDTNNTNIMNYWHNTNTNNCHTDIDSHVHHPQHILIQENKDKHSEHNFDSMNFNDKFNTIILLRALQL